MGHEHHFLSRLDRVSLPHVERALSLYRDHQLVRFLLGHVPLPEGAERVAISLADPVRGPFLIVTRTGRFVTCLGEGMKPGRLPIVTRERLDGITAKHGVLRAGFEASQSLGGMKKMMQRLYEAGDALSREEIAAMSDVAPLLRRELFGFIADAAKALADARHRIYDLLGRTDKPKPLWHGMLEAYYKTFWCALHMEVLLSAHGRELFDMVSDGARRELRTGLTGPFFEHDTDAHVVRAVWSVGKLGRSFLPNYKDAWGEVHTLSEVVEMALSLAQIGLRHVHARGEVRKVITTLPPRFGRAEDAHPGTRRAAQGLASVAEQVFTEPEVVTARLRDAGARYAVWLGQTHLPLGHPHRYAQPEEVPADLALPLSVSRDVSFLDDRQTVGVLFYAMPWMARARAEDLYLPRSYVEALFAAPWEPEHTLRMFRSAAKLRRVARADQQAEGPSRSGPCSCGSGKKYKRCCGAGWRSAAATS
jgi:hypothetical protein